MSKLPSKVNLIIAFSSRKHGNMSLYYGDTKDALNNRKVFLDSLGIDYRDLVCARQAHGGNIRYITEADKGRGAISYDVSIVDTDGFITDKKNIPLAVSTADCLSVFLYDQKKPAIGLIHAGWRSSKENIIPKAIKLMKEKFNTDPRDLFAGFGPSIRSCCYEVGEDFKNYFSYGLSQKEGKFYLDLAESNTEQLIKSGVKAENIFPPQACTFCNNEEFFSFRKEGKDCGRMISVIMLK